MRKSLCIIALAASLTAGAQTYYSENFSAAFPGDITVENVDGYFSSGTYRNLGLNAGKAWLTLMTADSDYAAMCPTYHYGNTEPQSKLMILPRLSLPAVDEGVSAPILRFRSCSYYRHRPESFRVLARRDADDEWAELLSVVDESADWTYHFVSLADYCGADVQLAFDACTPNGFLLAVDNLFVGVPTEGGPLTMVNETPHYVGTVDGTVDGTIDGTVRVGGRLFNPGAPMHDVMLQLKSLGNQPDIVIPEIGTGQEVEVEWMVDVDDIPETVGVDNPWYSIQVKDMNVAPLIEDFICKSAFARRHVVERFAATWCQSCPSIEVPLEGLVKYYGDQMIPVGVHMVNDVLYNSTYNSVKIANYIFNIPAVAFNHAYQSKVLYKIDKGNNYNNILPTKTIASISASAYYDAQGNVSVETRTQFDDNYDNSAGRYAVGYALLGDYHKPEYYSYEQSCGDVFLPAAGAYYYASSPMSSQLTYYENVPVLGATAYGGVEDSLPAEIESFTEYKKSFILSTSRFDGDGLRVLVMVIDTDTKDVLNADLVEIGESSGVQQIQPEACADSSDATVEYYDLTGRRLASPTGLHIQRRGTTSRLIIKNK